jgi:uncharacterized protein (DUF2225 family)
VGARRGIAAGVGVLVLACGPGTRADTKADVDHVCPLCKTEFKAVLVASGYQSGQRLDLRPIGAITSPWLLAVCPKDGFVLFRGAEGHYTREELETLRARVDSDEYRKLGPSAPSYQRLAMLYEGLKRPPDEIAQAYLKASWQAEGKDEALNRTLLVKSREWLDAYLASSAQQKKDETWRTAAFLRGELLRRLGAFDEAREQFDRLGGMKEFQEGPFPRLIAQEAALIQAKDQSPQEIADEEGR